MEEVGKKEIEFSSVFQIFCLIAIVYLSQMIFIVSSFGFDKITGNLSWLSPGIGITLAMGVPYLVYSLKNKQQLMVQQPKNSLLAIFFMSIIAMLGMYNNKTLDYKLMITMVFIVVNEECFYRGIIQKHIEKYMNVYLAVIIQCLLFTFLNHSSETLFDNLFIRFPVALVLTTISKKYGLALSILGHFVFNIIQF